jgi:hypothetical protein
MQRERTARLVRHIQDNTSAFRQRLARPHDVDLGVQRTSERATVDAKLQSSRACNIVPKAAILDRHRVVSDVEPAGIAEVACSGDEQWEPGTGSQRIAKAR